MTASSDRYQLTLHGENIPLNGGSCLGFAGKKSSFAKVKITSGQKKGMELGETEPVVGHSPEWTKTFFLEFSSSEVTNIEVTVMEYREGKEPIWVGEANFEATSVFQSPFSTTSDQIGRSANSKLYCHIQKSSLGPTSSAGYFDFHLRGLDMKNLEPGPFGLGRSDPFFEIAKKDADHTTGQFKWNVVYRSEHIPNSLNPYWKPCRIGLEELCYGQLDFPLKISVFDHNANLEHKLIGEFETSIPDMQNRLSIKGNADRDRAIGLSQDGDFKVFGLLCILKATVVEDPGQP